MRDDERGAAAVEQRPELFAWRSGVPLVVNHTSRYGEWVETKLGISLRASCEELSVSAEADWIAIQPTQITLRSAPVLAPAGHAAGHAREDQETDRPS